MEERINHHGLFVLLYRVLCVDRFVPERKLQTPNNWRYVYKRNRIGILDGTTKDASTKDASTMSSKQKSDPKQTFWWKNE